MTSESIDTTAHGFRLVETLDLEPLRGPMGAISPRVEEAIARGVRADSYPVADVPLLLDRRR